MPCPDHDLPPDSARAPPTGRPRCQDHRFRATLAFALAYALAITLALAVDIAAGRQAFGGRVATLLGLFAAAAFAAGLLAPAGTALLAATRPARTRFAAMTLLLVVLTAGFSAFFYFLQYQAYFSAFHAGIFTAYGVVQLLFTGASAAFQFAVFGLRLFLPAGLLVVFIAAFLHARQQDRDCHPGD